MTSPFLYFAGRGLSPAELSAARLDGDVVDVDAAYIPADAVETPALRAAALAPLAGRALAVTHLAAAWVHGAVWSPPVRVRVQRAVPRRLPHIVHRRLDYRDPCLPPEDIALIGGVRVTTPLRTVCDLLRDGGAGPRAAARRLVDAGTVRAGAAVDWLRGHGSVPGKRPALAVLRGWSAEADQAEVTRYTS